MSELRVKLSGEGATLGEVAAGDVARLILGVERAIAQAAAVVLGRPKTTTGRYEDPISRASRLKLRAVEEGSVVPVLEVPDAVAVEGQFDVDVESLSESALYALFDAADPQQQAHPIVAKALLDIADQLHVGERYEAVTFESTVRARRREVRVDGTVRARLRHYVDSALVLTTRPDSVSGVLVEADFEKRTARLRTVTQSAVLVAFDEDLDDAIHTALREPATLRGQVVYDPKTNIARSVVLRAVERGEQLVLGLEPGEYWRTRTIEDLAREQGAGQPIEPETLYDADASEGERDAFMAAIAEFA